jgi:hypothetical protein
MELELNNFGFFNLAKPEMVFDFNVNSFKTKIDQISLSKFLSMNEVFLNEKRQITDGSHVYGIINFIM